MATTINIFDALIFILSWSGCLFGSFTWLNIFFQPSPSQHGSQSLTLFKFCSSWFLCLGLLGLIASLNFYLNGPKHLPTIIFAFLAVLGWSYALLKRKVQFDRHELKFKLSSFDSAYSAVIIYFLLHYLYRSGVTWYDQDEISQYGYYSKLIGNGWGFTDLFHLTGDASPKYSESLYGYIYGIFSSIQSIRLMKFLNLNFITLALFAFLRINNVRKTIALFICALFLGTPEFSYLMTSTKVDNTLMVFELMGLFYLLLYWFKTFPEAEKNNIFILSISCLFAYMATAARLSGAYSASLATLSFIFYATFNNKKFQKPMLFSCIVIVLLAALAYSHPYLFNLIKLKNPIYPFMPPSLFPQKLNLNYRFTVDSWKDFCNLKLDIPFPLYQLYLLVHLSLGLETRIYDFLTFLPHASGRGVSLGWLNPAMLSLFIAPFFARKDNRIVIVSLMFLVLFFIWSFGVQLTRVFMGPQTLSLCLLALILNLYSRSEKHIISKALRHGLITLSVCFHLVLFFTMIYHAKYSIDKYGHQLSNFWSTQSRFSNTKKIHRHYYLSVDHYDKLPYVNFEYDEIAQIESVLNRWEKPIVLTVNMYPTYLHVFFKNSFILVLDWEQTSSFATTVKYHRFFNQPPGEAASSEQLAQKANCSLVYAEEELTREQAQILNQSFPETAFVSSLENYKLKCKTQQPQ